MLFLAFLLWAAYQTEVGWLYVLAALDLALLSLGAAVAARALADVRVEWTHRETLFEGDSLPFSVTVRRGRRALQFPVEIDLSARRGRLRYRQRVVLWSVAPDAATSQEHELLLPRFGRYVIDAPRVALTDPLGLFRCARRPAPAASALVYPAVDALVPRLQIALAVARGSPEGPLGRTPEASLFTATRPYVAGDPRRHIHWRSLARFGDLAVKQLEDPTHDGLLLLLDNTRGTGPGLDEMIRVAAALVWAARGRREVRLGLPALALAHSPARAPWPLLAGLAEATESSLPAASLAAWLADMCRAQATGERILLLPSPTPDRLEALARLPLRDRLTVIVRRLDETTADSGNRLVRWVSLGPVGSPAAA